MVPSIGVTTQIIRKAKWYKYVHELGFKTIEINRHNSKLHFDPYFLEKVKRYVSGFNLSVHSGTAGIFQDYKSFTEANLSILRAEIDICGFLEAKQFVFHLNDGFFSPEEKSKLREVIHYAADLGVKMLYESNSALVADYAFDVMESFPELGYVLDLGHLNNGYGSGKLGCSIDGFVEQVKNRIVYIHASNNYGHRDDHNGLEDGSLDWRHVLTMLDLTNIDKIIIEVRNTGMVENTATDLANYLNERFLDQGQPSQKICAVG